MCMNIHDLAYLGLRPPSGKQCTAFQNVCKQIGVKILPGGRKRAASTEAIQPATVNSVTLLKTLLLILSPAIPRLLKQHVTHVNL